MLKSSSLVLFLYISLISIFFIKNQNANKLKVLNDKPFPIYLSSSKNATHYFIITTEYYRRIFMYTNRNRKYKKNITEKG